MDAGADLDAQDQAGLGDPPCLLRGMGCAKPAGREVEPATGRGLVVRAVIALCSRTGRIDASQYRS